MPLSVNIFIISAFCRLLLTKKSVLHYTLSKISSKSDSNLINPKDCYGNHYWTK